jgi:alanine racemase
MSRPALALMSGARLRHNLGVARDVACGANIYGVIKADAYGHGLEAVAQRLVDAGVDGLAVATLEEALAVRRAHPHVVVLLLEGVVDAAEAVSARASNLDLVVHCSEQIGLLPDDGVCAGRVWLKHDTGMHRLGLDAEACAKAWQQLTVALPCADIGLLTHFASADEADEAFASEQQQRFAALCGQLGAGTVSNSNSAALLRGYGAGTQWVRPGLMLYGLSPFSRHDEDAPNAAGTLRPVMQLVSAVISVVSVNAGETVGYGRAWRAERDSRIAVVALGYGDGYPRHAPSGTPVLINGTMAPLAGRVSMDMLSVDVTELAPVKRGDPVLLWGDGLSVEEVAGWCGTIAYELVCKVSARVPRQWVD